MAVTQDHIVSMALLSVAWAWIVYQRHGSIYNWCAVIFFAKARVAIPVEMVNIGNDSDQLDPQIVSWLKQNCRSAWRFNGSIPLADSGDIKFWIDFTDIEDSILFRLAWS